MNHPDHIERELQFEASDLETVSAWIEAQPAYAAITIAPMADKLQRDSYLDTADWAIHRAGYSLRLRSLPNGSEATLKGLEKQSEGAQQRREINQVVSGSTEAWSGEPGNVSAMVALMTGGRALQLLFAVETRRRTYSLSRDGAVLAVLSLDDTAVRRDEQTLRTLHRVEVEEEFEGGLTGVQVLIDALVQACELRRAETSKFEAGLEAAGLLPEAALDFGYAELAEDAAAGEYAYALIRRYIQDFLRHEPGTRLGEDSEELHDMRVATRRLRAAMSTFEAVLPLRFQTFRAELQWVGQALGQVRDVDVQLQWLADVRESSGWMESTAVGPVVEELSSRRSTARKELLETLDSERYDAIVRDLVAGLREGDAGHGEAALPIRSFGLKVLKKRYRQFRRDSEGLTTESEAALYHAARIRGKHLRYATEALQPVFGRRGARMVVAMRAVQDVLGEMQDCNVTVGWLREIAVTRGEAWPPATLLRMGELLEQRRAAMESLKTEWPVTLAEVRKRWRRLRKTRRLGKDSDAGEEEAGAEEPPRARPPVQRFFWRLQRYFSQDGGPDKT